MNDYVQQFEEIADKHICPSEAHLVDSKILTLDMLKLIPYIIGQKVLELGYGDGMWMPKMIELFGELTCCRCFRKIAYSSQRNVCK